MQPWKVVVLVGKEKDNLIDVCVSKFGKGKMELSEYPIYPDMEKGKSLDTVYKNRRKECGKGMYNAMGIGRKDGAARMVGLHAFKTIHLC